MLAELERTVGRLYGELARAFSENASFWSSLEKQEEAHARLLLGLIALHQQGVVRFNANHFEPMAIRVAQRATEEHIASVRRRPPCLEDALSLALSIETSLLESRFFDLDNTDSPKVQRALRALEGDTKKHRGAIQERLRVARAHAQD